MKYTIIILQESFYLIVHYVFLLNVGLTAIHSLSFGTPVLTHNNFDNQMPEVQAINEGENGGFFIENDLEDLIKKIEILV